MTIENAPNSVVTGQDESGSEVTGPTRPTVAQRGRRQVPGLLISLASIVVLLVVWYLLTDQFGIVKTLYFPSMHNAWHVVATLGGTLLQDAWATAYRVVVSWAIGCLVGVLLGLLMSKSRVVYYTINPVIEALRPVPIIAFIPFTLLWFGLSDAGRIVLGVLVTAMIMIVSTVGAARNVNPVQIRAAQTLGASGGQVYRTVVLRAIFPTLVAALRVAAGFAWTVIVGAEFLGAQNGIGYLLLQASNSVDTAVVLVGTITVGIEAFVFDQLLRLVTNYFTRWVDRLPSHS